MKNTNWVKMSEQIPEMDTPVFAGWFSNSGEFVWHKFVRSDVYSFGLMWFKVLSMNDDYCSNQDDGLLFGEENDYPITHWMPLPQPPEGSNHD